MKKNYIKIILKNIPVGILIPVLFTVGFFIFTVFSFLLPYMENALMDKKREMIHELISTASSTVSDFYATEASGELTRDEAQSLAMDHIRTLRYGTQNENYFWVHDMEPFMLVHPIPELEWINASEITEPIEGGRPVFVEMTEMIKEYGEGYLDYIWSAPDDPDYIAPMISYARIFEPWGWVIGTGIFFDDVYLEISSMRKKLTVTITVILMMILALLSYNVWTGIQTEIQRTIAEKFLKISEAKNRTLLENVPVGIYRNDVDPLSKFFMINPALVRMLGIKSEQEALKAKISEFFVRKSDAEKFAKEIKSKGRVNQIEVELKKRGGENNIWGLLSCKRVKEDTGHVYFDGMIENITERKKAAIILKESYEKLKKLDKEKDEFIAIASHEMRTPMGIINGYISLLLGKMGQGISVPQQSIMQKIQKNVKRLISLVNGMLDIQKIEAGGTKEELQSFALSPIIESVVKDFQISCEPKKLSLSFNMPSEFIPTVLADEEKLRQVLINLVGNAVKFTPQEGTIEVLISPYKKDPQFVRVSVKDSGTGIPEEELKPIFEKFHQAQDHLEHTEEGTGLGLSICKKIVEDTFGGQIWAESYNRQGSEFIFTLKKSEESSK